MKTENATFIQTLLSILPKDIKSDLAECLLSPEPAPGKTFKSFKDIKSFSDACESIGTSEEEFNRKYLELGLDPDTINYERLKIIAKAINFGWTPDWSNTNQAKWFPWFEVRPSGSGFSSSYSSYYYDTTYVGSRLCTESREKAKHVAMQFEALYEEYLLYK
jgi:hypothetical protein